MTEALDNDLVRYYCADVLRRTHAFEELALQLASKEFVSKDAPTLLKALARMCVHARSAILIQLSKFEDEEPESFFLIRAIDQAIRDVASELRLPGRATSDRVPGVLARLVADKASEVVGDDVGVILRPQWHHNYKIDRKPVQESYVDKLKDIFEDRSIAEEVFSIIGRPLYTVSFPALERNSVHLHAVLGHELGHLMATKYVPPSQASKDFLQRIRNQILDSTAGSDGKEQITVEQTRKLQVEVPRAIRARECAIREFAADVSGVLLFGIAGLLSSIHIAIGRSLDGIRESSRGIYPPWGIRIHAILTLAEEEGWLSFDCLSNGKGQLAQSSKMVRRYVEMVKAWVGNSSAKWHIKNPVISAAHKDAEALLPDMKKHLKETYASTIAKPDKTWSDVEKLYTRLSAGIPPDNVGENDLAASCPSLCSVFTVAWWYRIAEVRPEFENEDLSNDSKRKADRLQRLTLKAIENCSFVTRFRDKVRRCHGEEIG